MQDRLLIATRVKQTIAYASKSVENYPHQENVLKNHLLESFDHLLRLVYLSNIHVGEKKIEYRRDLLVELKMIDYYLAKGYTLEWIEVRVKAILDRKKLTDSWKNTGINDNIDYA